MVSALAVCAVGLILLGAAGSNSAALYLARLLDGAARGAITATTLAYAADLCGKAETSFSRVRGFGALAAAAGAGFLIAPPIGDHLAVSYLPKLTMAANFGAFLALTGAAAAANFLRDPRRFTAAEQQQGKPLFSPYFTSLAAVRALSVVATAAVTSTLYHTLSGRPGMGVVATADTLALLGAAQLLTHGVLVAPLVRFYASGERYGMTIAQCASLAMTGAALALSTVQWVSAVPPLLLVAIAGALFTTSSNALLSQGALRWC